MAEMNFHNWFRNILTSVLVLFVLVSSTVSVLADDSTDVFLNLYGEDEYIIESTKKNFNLEDLVIEGDSEAVEVEVLESVATKHYDSKGESYEGANFTGNRTEFKLEDMLHTFDVQANGNQQVWIEYDGVKRTLQASYSYIYTTNSTVYFMPVDEGGFAFRDRISPANYTYIVIWPQNGNGLHWNQFSGRSEWETDYYIGTLRVSGVFHLFRHAENDEEYEASLSKIPGYVEVYEIEDGKQYLITNTNNGNYYIMKPGTNKFDWVGRLIPDSAYTYDTYCTKIKVKAKAVGEVSITVGSDKYNVSISKRYDSAPFSVSMETADLKTSFDKTAGSWGIVTKANGTYLMGSDYLPKVDGIVADDEEYVLRAPYNADEITGYYVFTNGNASGNMDNDARNAVLNANRAKGSGLNIDNYICPGNEYVFAGYKAVDIDGNEVILAADSVLKWEGRSLWVEQDDGRLYLEEGQTIKAMWKYRSSLATFCVDFQGTIFESDGNIERRGNQRLSWAVGVGRIYGGKKTGNVNVLSADVHDDINEVYVVHSYDENCDDIQITMELYADIPYAGAGKVWVDSKNYNTNQIIEGMLKYIRNSAGDIAVLLSPDGKRSITLNKAESDISNYSIRWYSIDQGSQAVVNVTGVMVVKLSRFYVNSVFDGLSASELEGMLNNYRLDSFIDRESESQRIVSMTVAGDGDSSPVYSVLSSGDIKTYSWVYSALRGSNHLFVERGYEVDGYRCVKTKLVNGVVSDEDAMVDGKDDRSEITFYNCYTPIDRGMVLISNTSVDGKELAGSVFSLSKDGKSVELSTNSKGMVLFNDLEAGEYTFKQVSVQSGYALNEEVFVFVVSRDEDRVVVKCNDEVLYESELGVLVPFTVLNESNRNTLIVEKDFRGEISSKQVVELFDEGYRIELRSKDGSKSWNLELSDSVVSADKLTYQWTLTDVSEGDYVLSEFNLNAGYKSTHAEVKLDDQRNVELISSEVRGVPDSAEFELKVLDGLSQIVSSTSYSRFIGIEVEKVSGRTGECLAGARFYVYTSQFYSSGMAPEGVDSVISYVNKDGVSARAYYLCESDVTDSRGFVLIDGVGYDGDYVLIENKAPAGYALDRSPVVIVRAEFNEEFYNGRHHVRISNSPTVLRLVKYSDHNEKVIVTDSKHVISKMDGSVVNEEPVVRDGAYIYDFLEANVVYELRESEVADGYVLDEVAHRFVLLVDDGSEAYGACVSCVNEYPDTVVMDGNGVCELRLPEYLDDRVSLSVRVSDGDSDDGPIWGIGFTLYREASESDEGAVLIKTTAGDKWVVEACEELVTANIQDDVSRVVFEDLRADGSKYYLLQSRGVIGYLSSDVAIEVSALLNQGDDGVVSGVECVKGIEKVLEDRVINIGIRNYSKLEMPMSGSDYTGLMFMMSGVGVIALSLFLLLRMTGSLYR